MLVIAATVFNKAGLTSAGDDLGHAYDALGSALGSHADILFGVALLASGLSSSSVGTLAGQVVMEGFLGRRIPVWLRRLITMLPAIIIIAVGVNPVVALVISQVVLAFGIPFALVPLVAVTRDSRVMGPLVNRVPTTVLAAAISVLIIAMNLLLIALLVGA